MRVFLYSFSLLLLCASFAAGADETPEQEGARCARLYLSQHGETLATCKEAAEHDSSEAQKTMGDIYFWSFLNTGKDMEQAAYWYRKAAAGGNIEAQYNMGVLYDQGKGVAADYTKSFKWFLSAANKGHMLAQFNLGNMYAKGAGVNKDEHEAFYWYQRAAEQGEPSAQYNIGNRYATGTGASADQVKAQMWYSLAAEQGFEEAIKNRAIVEKYMTAEQVAQAGQMVKVWQPKRE